MKRQPKPQLPSFDSATLAVEADLANGDITTVTVAAIRQFALVPPHGRGVDLHLALKADRVADQVLAALWRRGMLNISSEVTIRP